MLIFLRRCVFRHAAADYFRHAIFLSAPPPYHCQRHAPPRFRCHISLRLLRAAIADIFITFFAAACLAGAAPLFTAIDY